MCKKVFLNTISQGKGGKKSSKDTVDPDRIIGFPPDTVTVIMEKRPFHFFVIQDFGKKIT